jgi:hypothetical protein
MEHWNCPKSNISPNNVINVTKKKDIGAVTFPRNTALTILG